MSGGFQVGAFQPAFQQSSSTTGDYFGGPFFGGGFFDSTPTPPTPSTGGAGGLITFLPFRRDEAEVERLKAEIALKKKRAELQKVEKRIKVAEKKAEKSPHPAGILANLHLLEAKAERLSAEIQEIEINLTAVIEFLSGLEFDDDDEDILLLL